jgi:hypothetical protein
MVGHGRVWITRREDIARHWMAVHPAGSGRLGSFLMIAFRRDATAHQIIPGSRVTELSVNRDPPRSMSPSFFLRT